jgi:hypothetical protein
MATGRGSDAPASGSKRTFEDANGQQKKQSLSGMKSGARGSPPAADLESLPPRGGAVRARAGRLRGRRRL